MADSNPRNDALFVGIAQFIVVAVTFFGLYGLGGAEEFINWQTFVTYIVPGSVASAVALMISFWGRKHPIKVNGVKIPLFSYLHDPEYGVFKGVRQVESAWSLLKISVVIGLVLGLFSTVSNTFFAQSTGFQVMNSARIILAGEPSASAETFIFFAVMLPLFVVANLAFGAFFGVIKKDVRIGDSRWWASVALGVIEITVAFMLYHFFRYGDSEVTLATVAVFGFLQAVAVVLTGSIILAWVWHTFNNSFWMANLLFASETVVLATVMMIVAILLVIFISSVRGRRKT